MHEIVDTSCLNNAVVVRILVDRGCGFIATGDKEMTALIYAAKNGAENALRCFMDSNLEVNFLYGREVSALYYALAKNAVESLCCWWTQELEGMGSKSFFRGLS